MLIVATLGLNANFLMLSPPDTRADSVPRVDRHLKVIPYSRKLTLLTKPPANGLPDYLTYCDSHATIFDY